MKRKTYNNVLKAGKLIQAKGYSEKESLEIAVQKFDELASLKNGMSVEWLIDGMATKTEREGESMKLSESDKNYFKKCGYLDQDIPQIEKAIEVMQYEDENEQEYLEDLDKRRKAGWTQLKTPDFENGVMKRVSKQLPNGHFTQRYKRFNGIKLDI